MSEHISNASKPIRRPFNYRAFWSLLLAAAVIGLPWTGLENHLHGFDGITVERHAWMSAHNVLGLLFVIAVVAHVIMNGRALLRYARGLAARVLPLSREAVVAVALTAGLLFLAVGHAQLAGEGGGRGAAPAETGGGHGTR